MTDKPKKEDLRKDQQKRAINHVLEKVAQDDPSTYYLSGIQIAEVVKKAVDEKKYLDEEGHDLLKNLSKWDIQMLMSFHPE